MTKELDMWAKDKDVQTQLLDEEKRQSEIEVGMCPKYAFMCLSTIAYTCMHTGGRVVRPGGLFPEMSPLVA